MSQKRNIGSIRNLSDIVTAIHYFVVVATLVGIHRARI